MRILLSIKNFILHFFGINLKTLFSIVYFPKFILNYLIFKKKGGQVKSLFPILYDFNENAGSVKSHYFIQDLHVSSLIFKNKPENHIDIGSRIDGFISNLATFMKVDILDIRKLDIQNQNINFVQQDLSDPNFHIKKKYSSVSCLHTLEHFGLGRYGDKIDPNGHLKGLQNILKLLDKDAMFYLSFPISNVSRVEFNAHRVFKHDEILNWLTDLNINNLKLLSFDYIDDRSILHLNQNISNFEKNLEFGCGIYIFKKLTSDE